MSKTKELIIDVPEDFSCNRLDQAIAQLHPEFSRSQYQKWIKSGALLLDGKESHSKHKIYGGEQIRFSIVHEIITEDKPEPMALDIVFEDEDVMVINKPADLVVHPGAGNHNGTLVNGLLAHNKFLAELPRAGIVHRLDKDTTGLMMVAKTMGAFNHLVDQLQQRLVNRRYLALVNGNVIAGETIDENIGRHPKDRRKMAILPFGGKIAITHYKVATKLPFHTLLEVKLETGRTHQIRVHLSSRNLPIVGDRTYGGRTRLVKGLTERQRDEIQSFKRQALHAKQLEFVHPVSKAIQSFQAEMPEDMKQLVEVLDEGLI